MSYSLNKWEELAQGESGDIKLEKAWLRYAARIFHLFCQKQASYGPHNIAKFGERGVIIRANDKLERLINLRFGDKENPLEDETIEDTWMDLADYGIIGLLCHAGEWPFVEGGSRAMTPEEAYERFVGTPDEDFVKEYLEDPPEPYNYVADDLAFDAAREKDIFG